VIGAWTQRITVGSDGIIPGIIGLAVTLIAVNLRFYALLSKQYQKA